MTTASSVRDCIVTASFGATVQTPHRSGTPCGRAAAAALGTMFDEECGSVGRGGTGGRPPGGRGASTLPSRTTASLHHCTKYMSDAVQIEVGVRASGALHSTRLLVLHRLGRCAHFGRGAMEQP